MMLYQSQILKLKNKNYYFCSAEIQYFFQLLEAEIWNTVFQMHRKKKIFELVPVHICTYFWSSWVFLNDLQFLLKTKDKLQIFPHSYYHAC